MITTQMAYLSLCKLKQKWLLVSPFMLKKKSFQSKWRSGNKPVSPPLPSTPPIPRWRWQPENPSREGHQNRDHDCNQMKPVIQIK